VVRRQRAWVWVAVGRVGSSTRLDTAAWWLLKKSWANLSQGAIWQLAAVLLTAVDMALASAWSRRRYDRFSSSAALIEEIAPVVGRTPAATRQLASRARRRVRGAAPVPDPDLNRRREVVEAFLGATREGDFATLLTVLDPEVVLRSDGGERLPHLLVRGARAVADSAVAYATLAEPSRPVLVNGSPGALGMENGRPTSVVSFAVVDGRIVAMNILTDPARVAALNLPALLPGPPQ
jgi:hypothetical protein